MDHNFCVDSVCTGVKYIFFHLFLRCKLGMTETRNGDFEAKWTKWRIWGKMGFWLFNLFCVLKMNKGKIIYTNIDKLERMFNLYWFIAEFPQIIVPKSAYKDKIVAHFLFLISSYSNYKKQYNKQHNLKAKAHNMPTLLTLVSSC